MKNLGALRSAGGEHRRAAGSVATTVGQTGQITLDGKTRHEVARLLLEQGPMTAVAVSDQLGISPTAVRRHLDTLVTDGEIELRDASHRGPRGRGRPAKLFLLTELGRARFGHAYDGLAVSAIRFLGEHAGENAIRAFAERRVAALIGPHVSAINARTGRASRAEALASALSKEGYAASTRQVGAAGANVGVQLCQHHCPVAHVAAEFPQLCEAETEAFAKLLGTHVQRLATIARGDAACTTHVPVVPTGDLATIPEEITTEKIATEENGQSGSKSSLSDIASTEASFSSGRTVGSANGGQSR